MIVTKIGTFFSEEFKYLKSFSIQEKVERAQAANYSGVIIYNNKDDELIPMGESDVTCIILRRLIRDWWTLC